MYDVRHLQNKTMISRSVAGKKTGDCTKTQNKQEIL